MKDLLGTFKSQINDIGIDDITKKIEADMIKTKVNIQKELQKNNKKASHKRYKLKK